MYRVPPEVLGRAIAETREILIETAESGDTMTYTDVSNRLTTVKVNPSSPALSALLDDVSLQSERRHGHLLSVVVVRRDRGRPGVGFFALAREIGRTRERDELIFCKELKSVHSF